MRNHSQTIAQTEYRKLKEIKGVKNKINAEVGSDHYLVMMKPFVQKPIVIEEKERI